MMILIILGGLALLLAAYLVRETCGSAILLGLGGVMLIGHALLWWSGLVATGPVTAIVALLFGPTSIYVVGALMLGGFFSARGLARPIFIIAGLAMLSPIILIVILGLAFAFASHH